MQTTPDLLQQTRQQTYPVTVLRAVWWFIRQTVKLDGEFAITRA